MELRRAAVFYGEVLGLDKQWLGLQLKKQNPLLLQKQRS